MYCHLNPNYDYYFKGLNASNMYFERASNASIVNMTSEILNATTIRTLYNPNIHAADLIRCKINVFGKLRGICMNHVYVGGTIYKIFLSS